MSDLADKLFNTVKESLSNAPAEIGAELKHQPGAGAHELAAAIFNQSAFVMYPRAGVEDPAQAPDHGLDNQAIEPPKQQQGMSM